MIIRKSDVCIYLPAYNEVATIGQLIAKIRQEGYERIVVVDDGSTDQTVARAKEAKAHVIQHPINRGVGAATQTAIEHARSAYLDFIILMDADGQHAPKDIDVLVKKMEESTFDLVIGSRFFRKDSGEMPKSRKWMNKLANLVSNLILKDSYTDSQSGFRMLNARAIQNVNLTLDAYGFCSEMLFIAEQKGLRMIEVPVSIIYTEYSLQKGQNFFTGIQTAWSFIWKRIFK